MWKMCCGRPNGRVKLRFDIENRESFTSKCQLQLIVRATRYVGDCSVEYGSLEVACQ